MQSMRSYVAAHYIRNLTNSHCLPWLLRQQKTKISWKIAKLWPCVNYTYLVQPISTWAAHSMMIIKIEHQSQLASDLSGHILSWKAISKLGTLRVFINFEFDSHFLIKVQVRWKKRLCIILNIQQNFDFLFLSICAYFLKNCVSQFLSHWASVLQWETHFSSLQKPKQKLDSQFCREGKHKFCCMLRIIHKSVSSTRPPLKIETEKIFT